ncbi:hypothetical protein SCOCK_210127 [Actinacidiphila cocklensis]|uniref:Uncharacterized protein n=1 Tax=Actinacidiphila cocklensis TaxID=887465 RepID=A0A9W4DTH9_9ACTN|nr:hypothetical protein SCOCK_210127 [Actinacidiphila cocklensis]
MSWLWRSVVTFPGSVWAVCRSGVWGGVMGGVCYREPWLLGEAGAECARHARAWDCAHDASDSCRYVRNS